jgi:hypothetical protein
MRTLRPHQQLRDHVGGPGPATFSNVRPLDESSTQTEPRIWRSPYERAVLVSSTSSFVSPINALKARHAITNPPHTHTKLPHTTHTLFVDSTTNLYITTTTTSRKHYIAMTVACTHLENKNQKNS